MCRFWSAAKLSAPRVGLEPTTNRLTAGCSTIELSGKRSAAPRGKRTNHYHFLKDNLPTGKANSTVSPAATDARELRRMTDRVLIVGAGLAGLATAVALAPRGFRVTL